MEERQLLAITVSTLTDEADGSIVDGDISLRDAIAAAPSGETINFAAALTAGGPATLNLTLGELLVSKSLTIMGPGANLLTIDASGNDPTPAVNNGNGSRVFNVDDSLGTRSNVLFRGLTLTGADHSGYGGGIRSLESLTLEEMVVRHNSSANGGGLGAVGPLFVYDSEFHNNNATSSGGAIQISGSAFSAKIEDSVVRDNDTAGPGGGILIATNRTGGVQINRTLIQNNDAGINGGGLTSDSPVTVTDCSIVENHADGNGGGIRASHSNIVLAQVTVSGNTADGGGGGIFAAQPLVVRHSTIADNRANADNNVQATAVGGGIQYVDSTNPADPNRRVSLQHTIVADNFRGVGATTPDDLFSGTAVGAGNLFLLDYALVELNAGFNQSASAGTGPSVLGVDPKLGALANNGGPALPGGKQLLTRMPLGGSAAINGGNPAALAGVGGVPQFDQRGTTFGRILNLRIDLGAVEFPTSTLAGDYSKNGAVDAADYTVWRDTMGSTIVLAADGSGPTPGTPDGVVDQHDDTFWKSKFGTVMAAGGGGLAESAADEGAGAAAIAGELIFGASAVEDDDVTNRLQVTASPSFAAHAIRADALLHWLASRNVDEERDEIIDVLSTDGASETGEDAAATDCAFDVLGEG